MAADRITYEYSPLTSTYKCGYNGKYVTGSRAMENLTRNSHILSECVVTFVP